MGNCMNHLFSPKEKTEVPMYNEEGENGYELNHYSLPHSLLPPGTEPGPGVVGCLRTRLMQPPHHHSISLKIIKKESCQGHSIKILVSRKQLELLLGDATMLPSIKRAIGSSGTFKRGNRKWRPSLTAIPEVPDF
ncbi:hypothetical protein PTKIN_Ptkin13bG0166100 [Pterospermum kingtungense]